MSGVNTFTITGQWAGRNIRKTRGAQRKKHQENQRKQRNEQGKNDGHRRQ
jgi:hypothetical protein